MYLELESIILERRAEIRAEEERTPAFQDSLSSNPEPFMLQKNTADSTFSAYLFFFSLRTPRNIFPFKYFFLWQFHI